MRRSAFLALVLFTMLMLGACTQAPEPDRPAELPASPEVISVGRFVTDAAGLPEDYVVSGFVLDHTVDQSGTAHFDLVDKEGARVAVLLGGTKPDSAVADGTKVTVALTMTLTDGAFVADSLSVESDPPYRAVTETIESAGLDLTPHPPMIDTTAVLGAGTWAFFTSGDERMPHLFVCGIDDALDERLDRIEEGLPQEGERVATLRLYREGDTLVGYLENTSSEGRDVADTLAGLFEPVGALPWYSPE